MYSECASLELANRVLVEIDQINAPIYLFMDLSKACDTLDQAIWLEILKYYGITGVAHKLMERYMPNRTQNDVANFDMLSITAGVPQGSTLGSLLFIIYINNIPNSSNLFNFISYADDNTI